MLTGLGDKKLDKKDSLEKSIEESETVKELMAAIKRRDEHVEALVPAIRECILDVDIENQKMKIHLMDGLI